MKKLLMFIAVALMLATSTSWAQSEHLVAGDGEQRAFCGDVVSDTLYMWQLRVKGVTMSEILSGIATNFASRPDIVAYGTKIADFVYGSQESDPMDLATIVAERCMKEPWAIVKP